MLPFESLTGEEDRYLSDGLTEDVVVALQKAGVFEIMGRASTERYRGASKAPSEVAAELGVGYVVTGSVRRAGDQLRVAVRLTDGASDRGVWAEQYDEGLTVRSVFSIYSDVAESVARSLETQLDRGAQARLAETPTESFPALELYMRGGSTWSRRLPELMNRSIEYFDRAIDLDPTLAEARTSLAYAVWLHDWDWDGSEGIFRPALELSPDYATAHHWFGDVLAQRLRTEEALTHLDRALVLDPYAPAVHLDRANALFWAEPSSRNVLSIAAPPTA